MAIPKPKELSCRHAAAWAYITVPHKRGHSQELEHNANGDWEPAAQQGHEWLVQMQQHGHQKTEFRARYRRGEDTSPWITGRVWFPDGFEVDDDPGVKPETPYGLMAALIGGTFIAFTWAEPKVTPDSWKFAWRRVGTKTWKDRTIKSGEVEIDGGRRKYTVRDLAHYTDYEITVRAVIKEVESDPAKLSVVTTHREDDQPGPANPDDVAHKDVTTTTATITWAQTDARAVKHWRVGIPGAGPIRTATEQQLVFDGLDPDTDYTAQVWAVGHDSAMSAGFDFTEFRTRAGQGGDPRTPVPRAGKITETSIEVLWDPDPNATQYAVRRRPGHSTHRPTTEPRWSATGLTADTSYEFGIVAINDETGKESDEATITLSTSGSKPPPEDPPSVPSNIRAHCVHPKHAKVEWDGNPDSEQVSHYKVSVTGPSTAEREVIGTLVELDDLIPESTYTAQVRACRGSVCSAPATVEFPTGAEDPPPPPDPSGVPAPTGLYVDPIQPGKVQAKWDEPATGQPSTWWLISVDRLRTQQRVTSRTVVLDVPPGQHHVVELYAVVDGRGGDPTRISKITQAGVVTARKGT